jgi:hypothetical protein
MLLSCTKKNQTDIQKQTAKNPKDSITVTIYTDTTPESWVYKGSDYAFVAEKDSCKVQYNVIHFKKRLGADINVYTECDKPFSEQIDLHRAILKKIFAKHPGRYDIDAIYFHLFNKHHEKKELKYWKWNIPIIEYSATSKKYHDYRFNYPNTQYNVNKLFVEFANKTNAYEEYQQLFNEFGRTLTLTGVEKVFVQQAKELPIYEYLKTKGIKPDQRVLYDVGMSYFAVRNNKN